MPSICRPLIKPDREIGERKYYSSERVCFFRKHFSPQFLDKHLNGILKHKKNLQSFESNIADLINTAKYLLKFDDKIWHKKTFPKTLRKTFLAPEADVV